MTADSLNIQEYLGVDIGGARVGIARGNSAARLAQAIKTVKTEEAIEELSNLIELNSSSALVIGLPRGLSGEDTAQTKAVRDWAEAAKSKLNIDFFWQDEALTTIAAQAQPLPKNDTTGEDARAAATILQDFLDGAEDDRVAV